MKSLIVAFLAIASVAIVQAQTNISGTINAYTAVSAVDPDNCQITVSSTTGFAIGDQAILIQMQGATIDHTNTSSYGSITALGDAGNYEIVTIASIAGNVITLSAKLAKTYTVAGRVQLVSFPTYTDANITASLTGQAWNGTTGGVIALNVTGTLTFAAGINARGIGFGGGDVSANGCVECCNITTGIVVNLGFGNICPTVCSPGLPAIGSQYYYPSGSVKGGGKGVGIAGVTSGEENGYGRSANGGGGGNCHNFGGGGGGNGGAGGRGGNLSSTCFANATTAQCGGESVDDNGIGGLSLSADLTSGRVFLGGGGGGGHQNNATGGLPTDAARFGNPTHDGSSPGGPGGGIVLIKAGTLAGAGFTIDARGGNSPYNASADGAGGGGAGGTVMLNVASYTGSINVNVAGGNGSDSYSGVTTSARYLGPGGGGGGGFVGVNAASVPANVVTTLTGGTAGTSYNYDRNASTVPIPHGAVNGANGTTGTSLTMAQGSTACSVFPIQLFRLSAYSTGKEVELNWVLKGDDNYQSFTLEREDNGKFAPIYSTGYHASKPTYKYNDTQLIQGVRKYRVAVADIDGAVRYSNTVLAAPSDYAAEPVVTLFPNPVGRNETVAVSVDGMPVAKVRVYDLRGMLLYDALPSPTMPGLWELPLEQMGLSNGTYLVHIVGKTKSIYHKLVVVN